MPFKQFVKICTFQRIIVTTLIFYEVCNYFKDRVTSQESFLKNVPFCPSGFEVDFIIGDHTAVEVKAKNNVSLQDLRSLKALAEEKKMKRYLCVSLDPRTRRLGEITVLPLRIFLESLWNGQYS